ncbi:hypothetical protein RND81_06G117400 [Saponaria officinalis]|uniref:F-box domain-containing protein n=1 Tax=Saponaria officinalis TaxID=3572 RepID=A0AAW1K907_SAPOF
METSGRNHGRPTDGELDAGEGKRHKLTTDRLSELPDLALVHILSLLYTEEAAKASVLSKRFNSLCNSVDSLNLTDEFSGKKGEIFIKFVDDALGFCRRKFIHKFSLEFDYEYTYKKAVDRWLEFVAQKQVKSLKLDFNHKRRCQMHLNWIADTTYVLSNILHENVNLEELVTCSCDFPIQTDISCRRLRFLSISQSRLDAELFSRILGGCSVLETLELRHCTGFDKLKINSSSLRVLRIVGEQLTSFWPIIGENSVLELSGPYLVSLEVSGTLYKTKFRLTDVGSLVSAVMTFTIKPPLGSGSKALQVAEEEIAREVLESLRCVKQVTIGGSIIKGLSKHEDYNLSSPLSKLRSLTLCIPITEWSQLRIATLLNSSPYLESLVIELSYCAAMCVVEHAKVTDDKYYWKSWSTISRCPLLHLKTVKLVGFQVSCQSMKPIFEFLEFLLRNSKALEEIVIHASRYVTRAALDAAMKLLDIPTASPDVIVQFEPPHLWIDPLCMYKELAPWFFT